MPEAKKVAPKKGPRVKKGDCPNCRGRGWDEAPDDICTYCKGSGKNKAKI